MQSLEAVVSDISLKIMLWEFIKGKEYNGANNKIDIIN